MLGKIVRECLLVDEDRIRVVAADCRHVRGNRKHGMGAIRAR